MIVSDENKIKLFNGASYFVFITKHLVLMVKIRKITNGINQNQRNIIFFVIRMTEKPISNNDRFKIFKK